MFPPFELWVGGRASNINEMRCQYKKSLDEDIRDFAGDLPQLLEKVDRAHYYELNRGNELDSKAENYIRNMGFVLGILSLIPILTTLVGFRQGSLIIRSWTELGVFGIFLFGVMSLFISVYYSASALQVRGYLFNYTARGVREEIQNRKYHDEDLLAHLLECKLVNETLNEEKAFEISIAERLSRNGLISIGTVIVIMALFTIPIELSPLV